MVSREVIPVGYSALFVFDGGERAGESVVDEMLEF